MARKRWREMRIAVHNAAVADVYVEAERRRELPTRANDFDRLQRKLSGLLNGTELAAAVRELRHVIDV